MEVDLVFYFPFSFLQKECSILVWSHVDLCGSLSGIVENIRSSTAQLTYFFTHGYVYEKFLSLVGKVTQASRHLAVHLVVSFYHTYL